MQRADETADMITILSMGGSKARGRSKGRRLWEGMTGEMEVAGRERALRE